MTEELTKVATDKLIEVFDTVTKSVAPAALELAQDAVVVSGIQGILAGLACLAVAICLNRVVYKCIKTDKYGWGNPNNVLLAWLSGIFYIISSTQLLCVWNWVAIVYPKLALVNKILKF